MVSRTQGQERLEWDPSCAALPHCMVPIVAWRRWPAPFDDKEKVGASPEAQILRLGSTAGHRGAPARCWESRGSAYPPHRGQAVAVTEKAYPYGMRVATGSTVTISEPLAVRRVPWLSGVRAGEVTAACVLVRGCTRDFRRDGSAGTPGRGRDWRASARRSRCACAWVQVAGTHVGHPNKGGAA